MITEKDIQKRLAEILTGNGFNVVASEVDEGFDKSAVFVMVYPSSTKLLTCGGATEEMTVTVEIQYISALETVEDCIDATNKIKQIFLYKSFDIQDRHITVDEMEFEIEKTVLYVYFEISLIQAVDNAEDFEEIKDLIIKGVN